MHKIILNYAKREDNLFKPLSIIYGSQFSVSTLRELKSLLRQLSCQMSYLRLKDDASGGIPEFHFFEKSVGDKSKTLTEHLRDMGYKERTINILSRVT